MKKLLPILAVTAFAASAQAQIIYDFNGTAASFTDNFTTTTGSASWNSTGGITPPVGGSGNVTYGTANTVSVLQTSFDGGTNGFNLGVFFQASNPFSAGGARILALGFTSGNADTYSSSATTSGTDFRVVLNRGTHPAYGIQIHNDGTQVDASSNDVTLTAGNWYHLSLNIGGVSSGNYTGIFGELSNATSAGVIGSSLKLLNNSGSNYTATSSLTSDSTVYSFFGGQSSTAPIARIDNLSVSAIPEPSSAILLGLGLAACLALRRRRTV